MPSLVLFGAGNIGRGFIAPVFTAAGWQVTMVDIDQLRIAALQHRRAYTIIEVAATGERSVSVAPVDGILASEVDAVAAALADCDCAATAVGLAALPHLGVPLAAGLAKRDRPLDVLLCENGLEACDCLRTAVRAAGGNDAQLGCVRTSIGRMIPPGTSHDDPLMIRVEPYNHLPVASADFRGPIPQLPGLEPQANFSLVVEQKLYLHNASHAVLAYLGAERGYATIPDCMDDAGLVALMRQAAGEVSAALVRAHADSMAEAARIAASCGDLLDDLCLRYRNRGLGDPVPRVARDPVRKLGPRDRLIGAARLCHQQGVVPQALAHAILAACRYRAPDDDPGAAAWNARHQAWPQLLADIAQLDPEDDLMSTLTTAERQLQAAQRIRAAGLLLRDDEMTAIEIADFGLDRFDQIGLAISVYINTDRYCAKELAMLPGQICPEHRHPSVDGMRGKQETFRVRAGTCHLFLPGLNREQGGEAAAAFWPADKRDSFTVCKQLTLQPGEQYTIDPDTPHWFVAGPEGCVVSEFSSASRDDADIFTDPIIDRMAGAGPHPG
jgi:mannitol-1-phosphate 5-dehydrogenase